MNELVELYKTESANVFSSIETESIVRFVNDVCEAYDRGSKIYCCGNGGNAAYVANLVTDFNMHPFVSEDKSKPIKAKRLHAINMCDSVSTITAISNDIGPDYIFSEQLVMSAKRDDLLIGFSGSGNSQNIVQAVSTALDIGMYTHTITRNDICELSVFSHYMTVVPGVSQFPGQTGKNNNNFHFEDCISKLTHVATGILKMKVENESK